MAAFPHRKRARLWQIFSRHGDLAEWMDRLGIDAAYRLNELCPGKTYAIVEGRDAIGGTWDLFRFPGIRSDSDMFPLCYPFRPWLCWR